MKIIAVDNFNRDDKSDLLIASHVSEFYAEFLVDALNKKFSGDTSSLFFKSAPDSYTLYEWTP